MMPISLLHNSFFKNSILFLFFILIINILIFIQFKFNNNNNYINIIILNFFKKIIIFSTCLFSIIVIYLILHIKIYNYKYNYKIIDKNNIFYNIENFILAYFYLFENKNFIFSLNKFNTTFLILFSILFPIIIFLFSLDFNKEKSYLYFYMLLVFFFSYILLIVENIFIFYIIYEIIIIILLYIMYQSSSSRGSIEAMTYFLGWAILGSILIGFGFISIFFITNQTQFFFLKSEKFTENEMYWIYLLFYLGFGIKLSLWPFWYWLPKAHVEVSTSISIFLSCVLIKISLYCLLKIQSIFLSECNFFIFIILPIFGILDIIFRITNVKDLKAIVAYSSVLHTNLLIILIHIDSLNNIKYISYYIWGHSLLTTIFFLLINIIENNYNSRNILYINGINMASPFLSFMIILSLIPIFEIPISIFFWGEIWTWFVLFDRLPLLTFELLFLVSIVFNCIFIKHWWNIIFGSPNESMTPINNYEINFELILIYFFLITIIVLTGIFPNYISNIINIIIF